MDGAVVSEISSRIATPSASRPAGGLRVLPRRSRVRQRFPAASPGARHLRDVPRRRLGRAAPRRGVSLEDDPHSQTDAITAYLKVLELEPDHAPAHINLGTLFYNRQDYAQAEAHYRKAVQVDGDFCGYSPVKIQAVPGFARLIV